MARSRSYQEDLLNALQDPQEAKEYLNAALEDSNPEVFLLALRDVVEANLDPTQLEMKINSNDESLFLTLSEKRNPELANIKNILRSLGYRLAIELESSRVK